MFQAFVSEGLGRAQGLAGRLLPQGIGMPFLDRTLGRWRSRPKVRYALALSGGGVIGGMYEVGALAALEERLKGTPAFDIYVGCSAGSVVASLLANGVRATEIYRVLEQDLDDPLNFRRGAVFASDAFRRACTRFGRLVWAIGKNTLRGRGCIPDILARAERDMPSGFFSLAALERYMRQTFASHGLTNSFPGLRPTLLIPAVELDTAERVVFGRGGLRHVAISDAIAASSAIPGFFDPYSIEGRDYVDGGVGFSAHADLAAEEGADVVFVVNPLVPAMVEDGAHMRARGVYTILEQSGRIYSQNLLTLGLTALTVKYPRTTFFLLQPPRGKSPLFGPSMGFEASRAALRYGYSSTLAWLEEQGAGLLERMARGVQPAGA